MVSFKLVPNINRKRFRERAMENIIMKFCATRPEKQMLNAVRRSLSIRNLFQEAITSRVIRENQ
uniref:Uncharacterized protein n=1 Tax=Rhizophora mucronata TaxID=61149 RepID=A0A2P2N338_RHIMU